MKNQKNAIIGIYKITSPSGKIYIGQTSNWIKRVKKYSRVDCKGQIKLYNSLKKYGFENHIFELIEECSIEQLDEREIYWIGFYNSVKEGLNVKGGGEGGKWSEESKIKYKELRNTPEWKEYSSKLQKGRKRSQEFCEFIGNIHRGSSRTDETKIKMSQSKKGTIRNVGSHRTAETKLKMSLARKGEIKTLETRKKMSLGRIDKNTKPIMCIETGIKYPSTKAAAIDLNIRSRSISNILRGLAKQTKNKLTFIYL